MVAKIRARWPEGDICGPCFTTAARTYGLCSFCGAQRLVAGQTPTGEALCRDCAGITTNLDCDNCGREAERLRGGHCARCVVTADLEQILAPHHPPDMRLKRLIVELAAVPRPESIITWMRQPATAALLTLIGTRELQLSHDAFDAMPPSKAVEHLREMLVAHRMMPDRGDRYLARFEQWLDQRLQTLHDTPTVATPIEQFARWHHLRRLRENDDPTRNMDNATRCAKQEITEAGRFLTWLLDEHATTIDNVTQGQLDAYLSEGTTTRTTIRNFIQWRARAGIAPRFKVPYRVARTTPPGLHATTPRPHQTRHRSRPRPPLHPHRRAVIAAVRHASRSDLPTHHRRRHQDTHANHHLPRRSARPHPPGTTPPVSPTPRAAGQ